MTVPAPRLPTGRVKVVHVVTRLDLGGAQQNTLATVSHLDRRRFEPALVCGPGGTLDAEARALESLEPPAGLRFIDDLVREISPVRDLLAFFRLWGLFCEARPDVVHTHSSKAGILGRLAAALAGVPHVVHTFHGFGFHDRMRPATRRLFVGLERLAARYAERLVFVSRANMRQARELGIGDPSRYVLIRSAVRLSDFPARVPDRGAKRAELGAEPGDRLVVGVGNLKPQKNAGDFLRVAAKVWSKVPDSRFVFIGDGPLRAELEARVSALGLTGRVRFLGWRRDIPEVLAVADVFLLTSLWEGLPRALVEAMRSGLPCACYAADGVGDVLEDGVNGFCSAPGDWQALSAKVERLLADPESARRLGARARESISDEFDIDAMVRRQEELYLELVS